MTKIISFDYFIKNRENIGRSIKIRLAILSFIADPVAEVHLICNFAHFPDVAAARNVDPHDHGFFNIALGYSFFIMSSVNNHSTPFFSYEFASNLFAHSVSKTFPLVGYCLSVKS